MPSGIQEAYLDLLAACQKFVVPDARQSVSVNLSEARQEVRTFVELTKALAVRAAPPTMPIQPDRFQIFTPRFQEPLPPPPPPPMPVSPLVAPLSQTFSGVFCDMCGIWEPIARQEVCFYSCQQCTYIQQNTAAFFSGWALQENHASSVTASEQSTLSDRGDGCPTMHCQR